MRRYFLVLIMILLCYFAIFTRVATEDVFPSGHLKPFGSHVPPDNVEEVLVHEMISPKSFMENFVLPRKPLVFRGVVKDWRAYTKWTDEYLQNNHGNLELRMEGRKEKQSDTPQGDICLGRDSMKNFLQTYHNPEVNKYVVSELPTPLYKYVNIPPPMGCGDLAKSFVEIDLWINSGGARSVLHKDAFNTINCVVNGSKQWKLIEFQYNDLIYQAWEGPQEAGYGGYSLINPERVDLLKFPKISEIPRWQYTHIQAGDCLYLPSQMWHVVQSHGEQNLAVAFLFDQFKDKKVDDVNYEDCEDKPSALSLDMVDPHWKYPGYGRMSMGNAELPFYWEIIEKFFHPETQILSKKRMYLTILRGLEGYTYAKNISLSRTASLWLKLKAISPGFNLQMMKDLLKDDIREIINEYIEPPVAANSCEHEYFRFHPNTIREMIQAIAFEDHDKIKKEKFVHRYLLIGGSTTIAEEIWSVYAGDNDEVDYAAEDEKLSMALIKFEWFRMDEEEDYEPTARHNVEGGFKSEERQMEPDFIKENHGPHHSSEDPRRQEL